MWGRPARTSSGAKERFLRFDGLISVPFAVQNTRPLSSKRSPSPSISSSWPVRCSLRASAASLVSLTVRLLLAVLVGPMSSFPPSFVIVRRTVSVFYVHVFPTQRQKFALPEAGMQGHYVESFQTVASDGLQEPTRFVAGERVYFFGVNSWRVHVGGGVLCYVSPPHGLLHGLVQRFVHLSNRRGATPGIEPGAVEARHVRRT